MDDLNPGLDDDPPLHTLQDFRTSDNGPNYNAKRLRVGGGWLYIIDVSGAPMSSFVPDAVKAVAGAAIQR